MRKRGGAGPHEKGAQPIEADASAIRVAIAARPALYREALARLLAAEPGFALAGEAADESGAAELLRSEGPRVLLFDYEALGPGSEQVITRLRHGAPQTRVLVLATRSGAETVQSVLRAGASGLVGKELNFRTLVRAVRAVAQGEIWANRLATARALELLTTIPEYAARRARSDGALTRREAEIVTQVGLGLRNKQIAGNLKISEKTVRTHLNNVFRKLRMDNRIALALLARGGDQPKS
jgi:DNA-binding NarL/FixJ family response regulator